MRWTCCSRTCGLLQLAGCGDVQQLVVGNAAPQEERKARGQFQIADGGTRFRERRRRDRARCDRGTAGSPAGVRAPAGCPDRNRALCAPVVVERHAASRRPHPSPDGDTPGAPGSRESAWRTAVRPRRSRAAGEDALAAGRIARAGRRCTVREWSPQPIAGCVPRLRGRGATSLRPELRSFCTNVRRSGWDRP